MSEIPLFKANESDGSAPVRNLSSQSVSMPGRMSLTEKEKYRIMICGLGSIGSRLARLLQAHFDCDLAAYRSQRDKPDVPGIPQIYDWYGIGKFSPDIAFITNPTSHHMELAIECASRGMHLFIEKPLSHSLEGAETLQEIIRKKELLTYVGCNLRFDPIIRHLKETVRPEQVSHARVICSSSLPQWRPEQDYRNSYSAKKALGGGVILDLIHEPDYCAWLFGRINGIEGTAGKISDLEIETEDFADMVLRHDSGIQSHIHIDYTGRIPERKIEIQGDGFHIEADLLARKLRSIIDGTKATVKMDTIDRDYTYLEELRYFFRCIENRQEPMNSVAEHLSILKPLLDFKKSAGF